MARKNALVVGAGSMGRAWVKNLLDCPAVEFAGWVDIDQSAIDSGQRELQIEAPFAGVHLGEALEKVKPDFVVDVSTPESHCQVTLESLQAGVPVLGEKPMASSMDEARRMVFTSRETGMLYMVSQSRRYDPRIEAYKRAVQTLGPLGILNADFFLGPHFGGFRDQMHQCSCSTWQFTHSTKRDSFPSRIRLAFIVRNTTPIGVGTPEHLRQTLCLK